MGAIEIVLSGILKQKSSRIKNFKGSPEQATEWGDPLIRVTNNK